VAEARTPDGQRPARRMVITDRIVVRPHRKGHIRAAPRQVDQAAIMDRIVVRRRREGRIRAAPCQVHQAAIMDRIVVRHRREDRIRAAPCQAPLAAVGTMVVVHPPAGPCQVRLVAADTTAHLPVADRRVEGHTEVTPEEGEDRMEEALPVADIPRRDTTGAKGFLPRSTSLLTHPQETPKGVSCPHPEDWRGGGKQDFG
jgi:hypothetical protein